MLLTQFPYFVKFIFSDQEDDGLCFSFSDPTVLEYITYTHSGNKIYDIKIGHELTIGTDDGTNHRVVVTDIAIRHIFDDTDNHRYGLDLEDCMGQTGELKDWLFSVLVNFRLVR